MAVNEKRTNFIDEVGEIDRQLIDANVSYEEEKRKQVQINRKQQEKSLVDFKMQLEKQMVKLTNEQRVKLEKQFLKEYEAIRAAEERKSLRLRFTQERNNLVEYYKENSKLAEKERKNKDKQLDKELEIARLRSQIYLDEKGQEQKKNPLQLALDNVKADFKETGAMLGKSFTEAGGRIFKGLVNIGEKLSGEINSVISTFSQYQSTINTRLQGTAVTFQGIQREMSSRLGTSPFVKTSSMLESLNDLVAQGISFNLEQRAFLDALGGKIATTFDVANSSLLRIVKLQQQDSTASRLGMEAYLTRYFNQMFQDTQYLSQTFDSVTDALVEATSQMGTKQSVEFEYIVQKWLGSLSAVGTSESTVRSIAEAIGYLGAGNVSALNSSNMQNLLVMSASRAGKDYSSLLTGGLTAEDTNELLAELVSYMQEIGESGNQVVKSQFAQTFGLSISDLTAAKNIGDIGSITNSVMAFNDTISHLEDQFGYISERISFPEQLQNVLANIKFGIGEGIASNGIMAGLWSFTDLIQSVTGGIAIPAISIMGNMVDLNTTVENLIKTGLVGFSTLSKIPDMFKGLGQFATGMTPLMGGYGIGSDLISTDLLTRGGGFDGRNNKKGRKRGTTTSTTTYVGTGGSEIIDIATAEAMTPAKAAQEEAASKERTSSDIFNYLVYMLDPKLSVMTQFLGSMAGYNVGTTVGENKLSASTDYIMGYGTTVKVSEPIEKNTKNYEKLEELAANVYKIHNILQNSILNVKVTNIGDFLGSTV